MPIKRRFIDREEALEKRKKQVRDKYQSQSFIYQPMPTDAIIERFSSMAEEQGTVILPSTKRKIKLYLNKARANNLINSEHDLAVGAATLITAGINTARKRKRGSSQVRIADIEQGYRNIIRRTPDLFLGPGNHAPHNCLLRTVLTKEKQLRQEMPRLDDFLNKLGE